MNDRKQEMNDRKQEMNAKSMIVKNHRLTAQADEQMMSAGSVQTHRDEQINMYNEPPQNIISLHEFQKLSLDRL